MKLGQGEMILKNWHFISSFADVGWVQCVLFDLFGYMLVSNLEVCARCDFMVMCCALFHYM